MRRSFRRRAAPLLAGLAVLACAGVAGGQAREGFAPGQDVPAAYRLTPFYEPPGDLRRFRPGDVIRTEAVPAPAGARAWRVMYMSTTWDGRRTPVTGLVIAPLGRAAAPRPVLAWGHGTTGAARGCAPSLAQDPAREFLARGGVNPVDVGVPYLQDLLARGYVVVATDYQGLGGPGRHQFLVGDTAARGLLDIVRAARKLDVQAGPAVSLMGWSQGGQTVLFAGEIAKAYAPELKLDGIVALAPMTSLMSPLVDQLFRSNIPHVYLIAEGISAAYRLPMDAFTPRGRDLVAAASKSCILEVFKETAASPAPGVTGNITASKGWKDALARNDAGLRRTSAPVLIVHGSADTIVAPAGTPLYVQRASALGGQVSVEWLAGGDHRSIIPDGKVRILEWLDERRSEDR
jgi:alpha-beta hydrolase superfamily lysophospholipase